MLIDDVKIEETDAVKAKISIEEQIESAIAPEEPVFEFTFTQTEVNLIFKALGELKIKDGYNFVGKIATEVNKQKALK
jgi:hypothetical protein